MTVLLSMAAFALAASITPGPVNLVVLSSAAQHGLGVSLRFVTGATLGFTLLLLLTGLGLHELLRRLPYLVAAIQWGGVAFLLYMAFRLAADDGRLGEQGRGQAPTLLQGAVLGLVGSLLGCAIAAAAIALWERFVVDAAGLPLLPIGYDWAIFTGAAVLATLTGLASAIWPALRGARLDPVVAIRG